MLKVNHVKPQRSKGCCLVRYIAWRKCTAGNFTYAQPQGAGNFTYAQPQGAGNFTYAQPQGAGNFTYAQPQGAGNFTYAQPQGLGTSLMHNHKGWELHLCTTTRTGNFTYALPQGLGRVSLIAGLDSPLDHGTGMWDWNI